MKADLEKEIKNILTHYETKQAALLPVLNLVQSCEGWISPEWEEEIAKMLSLVPMQVREVVSFYTLYKTKPRGKYHIELCRNMSCDLNQGAQILKYLKSRLKIEAGEVSRDGRFSLECVECLGACELAPVMRLNGKYIGHLTESLLDEIIEKSK